MEIDMCAEQLDFNPTNAPSKAQRSLFQEHDPACESDYIIDYTRSKPIGEALISPEQVPVERKQGAFSLCVLQPRPLRL
jgi:hypothetical protein